MGKGDFCGRLIFAFRLKRVTGRLCDKSRGRRIVIWGHRGLHLHIRDPLEEMERTRRATDSSF